MTPCPICRRPVPAPDGRIIRHRPPGPVIRLWIATGETWEEACEGSGMDVNPSENSEEIVR